MPGNLVLADFERAVCYREDRPMARGRPRKVNTKDALHSVMVAFWQNGYSGTSMSDLAEVSGMAKPGLYAAFGDKEALFEKALLHYFETYGGPVFSRLGLASKDVVSDFRDFLGAIAELTLDRNTPAGCFLVKCAGGLHLWAGATPGGRDGIAGIAFQCHSGPSAKGGRCRRAA